MIHTVKGFGIVNKAEIDIFLKLSCFCDDLADVGSLISGSSAFSKTSLNIWRSSLRLTSIESVMPSSHLILCRPLLLLPPIPPSLRVFSNVSTLHMMWPKYWSFSFSIIPSNEHPEPAFKYSLMVSSEGVVGLCVLCTLCLLHISIAN